MKKYTESELSSYNEAYKYGYVVGRWILAETQKEEILESNARIVQTFTDREKLITRLEERANHDHLTGLLNRGAFESIIRDNFIKQRRQSDKTRVHCLLFLDLDNFKNINDTHGHEEGDNCLSYAARIIQKNLDRDNDFACRWGGEEFVVILGDTEQDGALEVARRIQTEINKKIPGEQTVKPLERLGITIGIAPFPHGSNFEPILKIADEVLLEAKKELPGKNLINFSQFSPND